MSDAEDLKQGHRKLGPALDMEDEVNARMAERENQKALLDAQVATKGDSSQDEDEAAFASARMRGAQYYRDSLRSKGK